MSKRPAAGIETYKDERLMWQAALDQNGLRFKCKDRNQAIRTIQRLHVFRALDRNNTIEGTWSIFDDFIIKNPDKNNMIVIERRTILEDLVITTLDGQPVDLDASRRAIRDLDDEKTRKYWRDQGIRESDIDRTLGAHDIDPNKPLDLE